MTMRLRAVADRRADNRLPPPTCQQCRNDDPMVGIIRTTRFVYFRCSSWRCAAEDDARAASCARARRAFVGLAGLAEGQGYGVR